MSASLLSLTDDGLRLVLRWCPASTLLTLLLINIRLAALVRDVAHGCLCELCKQWNTAGASLPFSTRVQACLTMQRLSHVAQTAPVVPWVFMAACSHFARANDLDWGDVPYLAGFDYSVAELLYLLFGHLIDAALTHPGDAQDQEEWRRRLDESFSDWRGSVTPGSTAFFELLRQTGLLHILLIYPSTHRPTDPPTNRPTDPPTHPHRQLPNPPTHPRTIHDQPVTHPTQPTHPPNHPPTNAPTYPSTHPPTHSLDLSSSCLGAQGGWRSYAVVMGGLG